VSIEKAKRDAFNLVWAIAQIDADNALLGVPATHRRKTKAQCRAKFMALLAAKARRATTE